MGPSPKTSTSNEYVAKTTLLIDGTAVDVYEILFGIRSVACHANTGIYINGEPVRI
jgi:beta-galactosidase